MKNTDKTDKTELEALAQAINSAEAVLRYVQEAVKESEVCSPFGCARVFRLMVMDCMDCTVCPSCRWLFIGVFDGQDRARLKEVHEKLERAGLEPREEAAIRDLHLGRKLMMEGSLNL